MSGSDLEEEASTPDESESTGDEEVADGAPEDVGGDLFDEPAEPPEDAVDSEEPAEGPGDDTAEASADEGIENAEVDAAGDEADDALEEVEEALGDDATDGNAGAPAAESPSNPAPTPRAPATDSSPAPSTAPAPAPVAAPSTPAAPPVRPTTEGSVKIVIFGFARPSTGLGPRDPGVDESYVSELIDDFVGDEFQCHMRKDAVTGQSDRSAICTMASTSDAKAVFDGLNGQEFDGRTMRVLLLSVGKCPMTCRKILICGCPL